MKKTFLSLLLVICMVSPAFGISTGSRPVIKSIQYVNKSGSGTLTAPTNFNKVDADNTVLLLTGQQGTDGDAVDACYGVLTDDSTITVTCGVADTDSIEFAILEFKPGVIKQKYSGTIVLGNTTASASSSNFTTPVVYENTLIFHNGTIHDGNNTPDYADTLTGLTVAADGTKITAARTGTAGQATVSYEVIEFYEWVAP